MVGKSVEEERREELKELARNLFNSISFAKDYDEALKRVDEFVLSVQSMRSPLSKGEDVDGHTNHLQGIHVPIMVNSIYDKDGNSSPSAVSEMHIGEVNGSPTLLITPEVVAVEEDEDFER